MTKPKTKRRALRVVPQTPPETKLLTMAAPPDPENLYGDISRAVDEILDDAVPKAIAAASVAVLKAHGKDASAEEKLIHSLFHDTDGIYDLIGEDLGKLSAQAAGFVILMVEAIEAGTWPTWVQFADPPDARRDLEEHLRVDHR